MNATTLLSLRIYRTQIDRRLAMAAAPVLPLYSYHNIPMVRYNLIRARLADPAFYLLYPTDVGYATLEAQVVSLAERSLAPLVWATPMLTNEAQCRNFIEGLQLILQNVPEYKPILAQLGLSKCNFVD
jgi:hypothetical protein